MRTIIQRCTEAHVISNGKETGRINQGLVLLVGFEEEDTQEDLEWVKRKVLNMRIFDNEEGVMDKSALDVDAQLLIISQFTLHASTKKGNRPSYIKAAKPDIAIPLYEHFIEICRTDINCETGIFGADMQVHLVNDGPVTISLDSKNKE